ncbi:MAG: NAD-dependent epimerase/dehydratase family protein [Thermoanaerobaculaceae bacterium]|nr:NAD-dependent epimerase/dehydratase family protein [Thermoanaerobaculaceae bacterium]MDI9622710.1 NAD-dependent epimerase/dehydratase family protein [Acidobacteriota bacterium]NLH10031.1 NAD-dependent epimerase/dehydratase family protein [Holophagae bacterium]
MRGWLPLPPELTDDELVGWTSRLIQPVAVTGATGFIGVNLVEALVRASLRPRALVRKMSRLPAELAPAVEPVVGDLHDPGALRELLRGAATVFHLAGLVRAPGEGAFDRANRVGTASLVEAVAEVAPGARLVHLSSLAAAGPSPDPRGRAPEDEPAPVSAYGRSKLAGERAVRQHPGPWVVVRPPAVYGPRDIDILQFFRLAARGVVPIPAGERFVTVVYVADVVRAVLAAASGAATGRVLHLGEPSPLRISELVAAIAQAGGVKARILPLPPWVLKVAGRVGDGLQHLGFRRVAMTSDKADELLARHWSAHTAGSIEALGLTGYVPFDLGAASTWEWYRKRGWVPHAKMRYV